MSNKCLKIERMNRMIQFLRIHKNNFATTKFESILIVLKVFLPTTNNFT